MMGFTSTLSLVNLFQMKSIIILISFNMCDGRHVIADEESTISYRMHTVMCTFYRLRSPLRHQRCRSLIFVVIIADEYERERARARQREREPGKRTRQKTERENKLNGRNTYPSYTNRSESTIVSLSLNTA